MSLGYDFISNFLPYLTPRNMVYCSIIDVKPWMILQPLGGERREKKRKEKKRGGLNAD